jgi:hypothetical protein
VVPAGAGSSPALPGGSGKTPGQHNDRSARSSLDWDRKERVAPVEQRAVFEPSGLRAPTTSQEARPELSCGVGSLQQVPRWNADRRRVPLDARRAPSSVLPAWEDAGGGAEVEYASAGVPPPLFFVARMSAATSGRRREPHDRPRIELRSSGLRLFYFARHDRM